MQLKEYKLYKMKELDKDDSSDEYLDDSGETDLDALDYDDSEDELEYGDLDDDLSDDDEFENDELDDPDSFDDETDLDMQDDSDSLDDLDGLSDDDALEQDDLDDETDLDIQDDSDSLDDLDSSTEEDNNFQGEIRSVPGACLVYKREAEDSTYEELWIYNVGDDINEEVRLRRAILAGTDIDPQKARSPDNKQTVKVTSIGNVQYLNIFGLPN